MGGLDIHILRRGKAYARLAGQTRLETGDSDGGFGGKGRRPRRRDYFLEGEALCREGRLNTTAAMSPGKLVTVTLCSLESIHGSSSGIGGRCRGSVAIHSSSSSSSSQKQSDQGVCGASKKGKAFNLYFEPLLILS